MCAAKDISTVYIFNYRSECLQSLIRLRAVLYIEYGEERECEMRMRDLREEEM